MHENRHEASDWNFKVIAWSCASILGLILVGLLVSIPFWHGLQPHFVDARRSLPPDPRLQSDPSHDLEALKKRDKERLTTYAWIDQKKGVIRLPIARAMELVLQEKLPARGESR